MDFDVNGVAIEDILLFCVFEILDICLIIDQSK